MTSQKAGGGPSRQWPGHHGMVPPAGMNVDRQAGKRKSISNSNLGLAGGKGPESSTKKQRLDHDLENVAQIGSIGPPENPRSSDLQRALTPNSGPKHQASPRAFKAPGFPLRPDGMSSGPSQSRSSVLAIERATMKNPVPIRPYVPDPPTCAPRYQDNSPTDFFPWTGRHAEDNLNEVTAKNGFFDKLQASQNESITARPSILLSLKNKSGPKILSSLFVSVLKQRQEHGVICTSSTFKPPPRVTLTDTKREAWLRDLANPSIPLRRLSRTIPHGIRGKILLDHCLSKDIPSSRAIWLVKCVGANEIRAFKRKGAGGVFTVGGENKWVQDWTLNVQQFLEGLISSCGSPQWKEKIFYGLRLASHIYSERLLDRSQYLNWLIQHLEESDLDSLPIWLLLVNLHKSDIVRCRPQGRRLVEAILGHLQDASKPENRGYQTLQSELIKQTKDIMASSVRCFLTPQSWQAYKTLVWELVAKEEPPLQNLFHEISERNYRLRDPTKDHDDDESRMSDEENIVRILDSSTKSHDYIKVAQRCHNYAKDHGTLVKTCLRWATCPYRYGSFRTYVAATILRLWGDQGIELQDYIHDFLASTTDLDDVDQSELFMLMAEMISAGYFSVGKYCQWLLARGVFNGTKDGMRPESRLLFEVPLSGLPIHVCNLRRSLLKSFGFSTAGEEASLNRQKAAIARQIPSFLSSPANSSLEDLSLEEDPLSSCRTTIKYEIAIWIRSSVEAHENRKSRLDGPPATNGIFQVTLDEFIRLRDIFEQLGAFSVYVDVIRLCSKTTNIAVLSAITDTVNYYYDIFKALSSAKSIFDILYNRSQLLPILKDSDKSLIHGLIDLAARIPSRKRELLKLEKDYSTLEARQSAAAPSPISDTMIDAVHSGNSTFAEEMDQLLLNGASIDEATLGRAFETITGHLQQSWSEKDDFDGRYSELLGRLRGFNQLSFDKLFSSWLTSLLSLKGRPQLSVILLPMICHSVVSLKQVLGCVSASIQGESKSKAAQIAADALELLKYMVGSRMPCVPYRCYRYLDELHLNIRESPDIVLSILEKGIQHSHNSGGSSTPQTNQTPQDNNFALILRMVLAQVAVNYKSVSQMPGPLQAAVKETLERRSAKRESSDTRHQISRLVHVANSLNVIIHQFEILGLFHATEEASEAVPIVLADELINGAFVGSNPPIQAWSALVSALPAISAAAVRERAEQAILSDVESVSSTATMQQTKNTEDLLDLVSATVSSLSATDDSRLIKQISSLFTGIIRALVPAGHEGMDTKFEAYLIGQLKTLLRLLVIHQSAVQQPQFVQEDLAAICISLSQLYERFTNSLHSWFIDNILDVLIILSDSLSITSRSRCLSLLEEGHRTPSPLLYYIFGTYDPRDCKWLQIVHQVPTANENGTSGAIHSSLAPGVATPAPTTVRQPYNVRNWEMVQDTTPSITENDASLSLTLFGTRKSVL